jgi:hypothetical protein
MPGRSRPVRPTAPGWPIFVSVSVADDLMRIGDGSGFDFVGRPFYERQHVRRDLCACRNVATRDHDGFRFDDGNGRRLIDGTQVAKRQQARGHG